MTLDEFWSKLEQVGWLRDIPDSERNRLQDAVADHFTRDSKYAFYSLAVTSFDPECIEGTGPTDACSYYSVLNQLARSSYGRFSPTDIHDELVNDNGIARISFKHASTLFQCEVPWEDDWFQEPVLELVNQAIKKVEVKEQFIPLPPCDQSVSLAFTTPSIYKEAVRAGLIPPDDFLED